MSSKQILEKDNISESSIGETKIYAVLSQFSVYELNRLRKFVLSPYFNKNMALIKLFTGIEQTLRTQTSVRKSDLWYNVTSIKTYNDQKFRKLCSDLLKLIERFLSQERFEENELHRAEYLLEAVHTKRLLPLYKSAVKTSERLSDLYFLRPASFYYHEYQLERNYYMLTGYEIARSEVSNVQAIAENLDKFYLAEKLRYYCTVISRSRMGAHDYQLLFMNEIIAQVESGNYVDTVPINLYYQIYLTAQEPEHEAHYFKLKELIRAFIRQLPELEAKEIMDSAYNYCIWKINRGRQDYTREIFELYKESVRNELIYVNGLLDPWNFRNIIVSGLRLGEYEWVQDFIDRYQEKIDEKYRENAVNFNLANLYFYRRDYNKVIELLQTVEYDDPSYNLNSKTILMATFYELEEIDLLSSLLSSFEIYLRRNKEIPESRKQHYLHLIRFTRSLIRISPSDDLALQKLRKKVDETDGVVNKAWLLEKIDALLKD